MTVSFNVRSSSSGSTSETAGRVAAFQMMSATTRKTTMISGATCELNTPLSGRVRDGELHTWHGDSRVYAAAAFATGRNDPAPSTAGILFYDPAPESKFELSVMLQLACAGSRSLSVEM